MIRSGMDQPELEQEEPEEHTAAPADVWERLDQVTRARVIELFAISAYNFAAAQRDATAAEDCDVSFRRDAEGDG